jgi:hypothetical protein
MLMSVASLRKKFRADQIGAFHEYESGQGRKFPCFPRGFFPTSDHTKVRLPRELIL